MSYKFYLELLRGGLYNEFWAEAKTGLVVFMDPKVYGRSPLEASSFIASSAFPDAKLVLPITSYSAFVLIWLLMFPLVRRL
jgi:hypothetical protein